MSKPSGHLQGKAFPTPRPRNTRRTRVLAILVAGLFAASLTVDAANAFGFGFGGFGGGGFGGMRGGGGGMRGGGGGMRSGGGGMRSGGGMQGGGGRGAGNYRGTGGNRSVGNRGTGNYSRTSSRNTYKPTRTSSSRNTGNYNKGSGNYNKGSQGKVATREPNYPRHPRRPIRWNYPTGIVTPIIPDAPIIPLATLPPNSPPPGLIAPNQPPNAPPNAPPPGQGPLAQAPSPFLPPPPGETRFVPDEVLLSIPAAITVPALDAIAQRNQLTRLDVREFTMTGRRIALMRINDGRPVGLVVAAMQAEAGAGIAGAQANFLYSLEQGAGAAGTSDQYAYAKMNLPQAHALARGYSVRVAVVDTPVDTRHPDLAGAVVASYDATGMGDPPHSHGTAIAGIIAARGKLTGSAPLVQILAIASFGARAANATSMNILKGLDWAGVSSADVVNMSFAGPADSELHRMLTTLRQKGIVLVAAAGNKGPSSPPQYPAAEPDVIAVTATDADDNLFNMANRGRHIAVAAPGVAILVDAPNGSFDMQSGTSMASAQVSGIAALLLERNRNLDPAAIREILTSTARDLGPAGPDEQFGAGLVDAFAALEAGSARASEVSASTMRPAN